MTQLAEPKDVGVVMYFVARQHDMPGLSKLSTDVGISAEMLRRTLSGQSIPYRTTFEEKYRKVYPELGQYIRYLSPAKCELTIKGRRLVEGLEQDNQALLYGADKPHAFVPTKKVKVPANKILKPSTSTILEAGVELFRAAHGMPLHELEKWVKTLTAASEAGMTLEKVLWSLGVILKDRVAQPAT